MFAKVQSYDSNFWCRYFRNIHYIQFSIITLSITPGCVNLSWYSVTQHNDTHLNVTQHNVSQHNAPQHNATQHNGTSLPTIIALRIMTASPIPLSIVTITLRIASVENILMSVTMYPSYSVIMPLWWMLFC